MLLPCFGLETSREEIFGHILLNFEGAVCIRKNQGVLFSAMMSFGLNNNNNNNKYIYMDKDMNHTPWFFFNLVVMHLNKT